MIYLKVCVYLKILEMYLIDLEFSRQDVADFWEILKTIITKFRRDAEKLYCSFNGLFQTVCCVKKIAGDTTL